MARGLNIEDCDAVINLELPSDASHYAHRAGRTGRAGRYSRVTVAPSGLASFRCLSLLICLCISVKCAADKMGQYNIIFR